MLIHIVLYVLNDESQFRIQTFKLNLCFISPTADLKLNVARPVKVNLSITKLEQCTEFMEKMTLPKPVEIDSQVHVAQTRLSMEGFGRAQQAVTPTTRYQHSVPIIVPGKTKREWIFFTWLHIISFSWLNCLYYTKFSITKYNNACICMAGMGQTPRNSSQPSDSSSSEDALSLLLNITDVSMDIVQFVVVIATVPDPQYPHMVFSMEGCQGVANITNDNDGMYIRLI